MLQILKKQSVRWILLSLAVAMIFGPMIFGRGKKADLELVKVTRGNIVQEVNVTGRLKPTKEVSLAFERGGKISHHYAKIGDQVHAGQILMDLNAEDLLAQFNQAQAGVAVAQAQLQQYQAALDAEVVRLEELNRGTRSEEVQLTQTRVNNAKQTLADAQTNLNNVTSKNQTDIGNVYKDIKDVVSDAYAKSDDSVRIKSGGVVSGDPQNGFTVSFHSCDSQAESEAVALRTDSERELLVWKKELAEIQATSDFAKLDALVSSSKIHLDVIKKFIDRANDLVTTSCSLGDPARATDRTNLATALTNVNAAQMSINAQEQALTAQKAVNENALSAAQAKLNEAQNALASAQDELALKQAGSTKEQMALQQAKVRQARANVQAQRAQIAQATANSENAQAQIGKTIIRSPIEGTVTQFDGKIGEIVAASAPLISVMSLAKFEIEANIPEVDIGSLGIENTVIITLDALPGNEFFGKVVRINPAETIVDGVVNFKVTVAFDTPDPRFKSGLTANLRVETARHTGVLILPEFAIVETDKGTFVRKGSGNLTQDIPVEIGIRGSDSNVEILSGVSEGESVINIGAK